MKSILTNLLFAGLLVAGFTSTANASLIEYTFTGDYNDGSTAAGTFRYDTTLEEYSAANITLDGGSDFDDSYFDFFHYTGPHFIVLLDSSDGPLYDNDNVFHIILQDNELFGDLNPMSIYSDIATCDKDHCPARDNLDVASSTTLTGSVIDATVPEPSIITLFGLGLVSLGFARKRQS